MFPIAVPALRDRQQDIVPLAELLLTQLCTASGRTPIPSLTQEAIVRLQHGAWPGNVRELRNALERALILEEGNILGANLFDSITVDDDQRVIDAPVIDVPLDTLERNAIEHALAAVGGNRREAAARLGIGLRTLYEKIKRYESLPASEPSEPSNAGRGPLGKTRPK